MDISLFHGLFQGHHPILHCKCLIGVLTKISFLHPCPLKRDVCSKVIYYELKAQGTNVLPRVSHLTTPYSEQGETSLSPGGGKMGDPGNEVAQGTCKYKTLILGPDLESA